jgi:hypothetical protein
MLAPISSGRRNKGSSFKLLMNYLVSERDPETGEVSLRGEVVLSDDILWLDTAAGEMEGVASGNRRCQDPVYHFQLTWQPGERPSRERWESAAKKAIADLGYAEHQYLIVAHDDKAHFHVHIMLNKVHPETTRAHTPLGDMLILDKALREIEHEQGWKESVGHYRWDAATGTAVRNTREERNALSNANAKASGKASKFEHYHDAVSLQAYVKDKAALDLLGILSRDKSDWGAVHRMLHGHGLEMKKGEQGGYTVHAIGTELYVKASDVFRRSFAGKANRAQTERQLGEWREATDADRVPVNKPLLYEKTQRQSVRDAKTQEREEARRDLKKRFGGYRAEIRSKQHAHTVSVRDRRVLIAQRLKDVKKQIRSEAVPWNVKKARLSQAVAASVAEQRKFRAEVMRERIEVRGKTYQEWVGDLAEKGDLAAVAQLRGWRYQDHRNAAKFNSQIGEQRDVVHLSGGDGSTQADWVELTHERLSELRRNEELAQVIAATRWTINRRSGDVCYTVKGKIALVDRGKTISILTSEESAIVLGLEMAVKKYGVSIQTDGSDVWKEQVARVAARNDVFVQFTDAGMQRAVAQEKRKLDHYGMMANQLAALQLQVASAPDAEFQLTNRDAANVFLGGIMGLARGRELVDSFQVGMQSSERRSNNVKGIFDFETVRPANGDPVVFRVKPLPGKGPALAALLSTAASQMRKHSDAQRSQQNGPQSPRKRSREKPGMERE